MFCEEIAVYAANRAMRMLGIEKGKKLADIPLEEGYMEHSSGVQSDGLLILEAGKTYVVETDSGTYTDICRWDKATNIFMLGNYSIADDTGIVDGLPFLIVSEEGGFEIFDANKGKHLSLFTAPTPIDPKYLFPRVELKTKMRTEDFFPYKHGFYPITDEDAAALEEARSYGIFYVSAHVADVDRNPWHIGSIANYAKYDDLPGENTEVYSVCVQDESFTYQLLLIRETTREWGYTLAVTDGVNVLNGDDFPTPEA